jgi:tRNA nucleotidyltransferase (CCA-adding enzyme)
MEIPPQVIRTLACLEDGGFSAYVVGGCVRDALIGIEPHDWDITTSALPAQTRELFGSERVLETGLRHGTVTLLFPEGPIEITTFRSDGPYLDGRRPESVRFVASINEDLARRDFTMNALAFNPHTGLVDPFKGREDIASKLIRAVGEPDKRLQEDALRVMRALRFSAELGFGIDEELAAALHGNRGLLSRVAPERVGSELLRMLVGAYVLSPLLAYPDVLAVFIPEIAPTIGHDQKTPYHRYDIWEHITHAVAAGKADIRVRLALLLHDLGKPESFFVDEGGRGHFYGHDARGEEIARVRLKALRLSTALIEDVAVVVRCHQVALRPENVLRWLSRLGEDRLRLLIEVKRGDIAAHADDVAKRGLVAMDLIEARLDELIAQQACFSLRDLAVDGNDLKAMGIPEGKEIGDILTYLLDAVLEGDLDNTHEELLAAVSRRRRH